jgi:hypothetical protein
MTCFSSGVMKTQLQTSRAVLPQPWQTSSNKVEQIPMQGESKLSGLIAKGGAGLGSGLLEFVIEFYVSLPYLFIAIGIEELHFLWSKRQF